MQIEYALLSHREGRLRIRPLSMRLMLYGKRQYRQLHVLRRLCQPSPRHGRQHLDERLQLVGLGFMDSHRGLAAAPPAKTGGSQACHCLRRHRDLPHLRADRKA